MSFLVIRERGGGGGGRRRQKVKEAQFCGHSTKLSLINKKKKKKTKKKNTTNKEREREREFEKTSKPRTRRDERERDGAVSFAKKLHPTKKSAQRGGHLFSIINHRKSHLYDDDDVNDDDENIMGENKNAMPILRKRQLKRRVACAVLCACVVAFLFARRGDYDVDDDDANFERRRRIKKPQHGYEDEEHDAVDFAASSSRRDDDDDDGDDEDNDDDDDDDTNSFSRTQRRNNMRRVKRLGALELQTPEFAFGGQWAPSRNQARLNEHAAPTFGCHATTSIHVKNPLTDKQEVLVAWFGGSYEGAEDVGIWTARRDEDTGVWSKPKLAAKKFRNKPYDGKNLKHNSPYNKPEPERKGGEPHWNPVLFCGGAGESDGDGASLGSCEKEIVLYFKLGWKIWFWETWEVRSRDGGDTWSEPKETVINDKGGRGPVKNKPIALSDGTWLAPASLEGPMPGQKRKQWRAFADISHDLGKTWKPSSIILPSENGYGNIQPTVWESEPGHVHMLLRSSRGRKGMWIWRSDSKDGGKTWTQSRKTKLPNNNSGLDVAYLSKSKVLVLAYNHVMNVDSRSPIRLAISKDNGENWELQVELDNEKGSVHNAGHEYSYPSCVPWPAKEYGEEGVSVTYTWHRRRVAFFSASLKELLRMAKPNDQLSI